MTALAALDLNADGVLAQIRDIAEGQLAPRAGEIDAGAYPEDIMRAYRVIR